METEFYTVNLEIYTKYVIFTKNFHQIRERKVFAYVSTHELPKI